jgi:hypothetical protein
LREIFSIFVLHSFSLLSLFSNAPRRLRVGVFCFCVFICNLIFVKKNVKWVGVKLSGKFRIIKLLFCSTLSFILLSFLLFLNGIKDLTEKISDGKIFRWKNIPVEEFSAVKTIKLRYRKWKFFSKAIKGVKI